MKKKLLIGATIAMSLILCGCGKDDNHSTIPTISSSNLIESEASSLKPSSTIVRGISVKKTVDSLTISDEEVLNFDFKPYFSIIDDGIEVVVIDDYIKKGNLSANAGSYNISCLYKDHISTIDVTVIKTIYKLNLTSDYIEIKDNEVANYDFKSLFKATKNNEEEVITDDMITSNVLASEGEYTYSVTYHDITKSIRVKVLPLHSVVIYKVYSELYLTIEEANKFDFKTIFMLYSDDSPIKITDEMLNFSSKDFKSGSNITVSLSYSSEYASNSATFVFHIVDANDIEVVTKNINVYPNSQAIDYTELFEVRKKGELIKIDQTMINGSVDFSQVGDYNITLNYNDKKYIAVVSVKHGVEINYKTSNIINILKGTNQDRYDFSADFKVYINGIEFPNISLSYLDLNNVDFNTIGSYIVKIRIPYNVRSLGIDSVDFEYYEKEITYNVVEVDYSLEINNELVNITNGINLLNNISLTMKNRKVTLVDSPNKADYILTVYAKVITNIDYETFDDQHIYVDVYVFGIDKDPVRVDFYAKVDFNVEIIAKTASIFTGDSLNPLDLFKITKNGTSVDVTKDMITGRIDYFKSGTYELHCNYYGASATAAISVLDQNLKGSYATRLTTIPVVEEDDSTSDSDYGYTDVIEEYALATNSAPSRLPNLNITDDGKFIYNNKEITILEGLGNNSYRVNYNYNEYMLYYINGIIILNPDNSIKLSFSENRRPLIFVNENKYEIVDYLTLNYSSTYYVLNTTYTTYSIDTFKIKDKETNKEFWYGLYVRLANKTSSDTYYDVKWDYVTFNDGFKTSDLTGTMYFQNTEYKMTYKSAHQMIVDKNSLNVNPYYGQTLTGTFNNKNSKLSFDNNGGVRLFDGTNYVFSLSNYDLQKQGYGGIDYKNNELIIYKLDLSDFYSYKFLLNLENLSFSVEEHDEYIGYYTYKNMYIFLDGYKTGEISFDASSNYRTKLKYKIDGNILRIDYVDTDVTFNNGSYIEFFISDLYNVLTLRKTDTTILAGSVFENQKISIGAIIRLSKSYYGANTDAIVIDELCSNLEIITSDGIMDKETLISGKMGRYKYVDTSKIAFSIAGFYELTINLKVNNIRVTSYYAIQILAADYKDDTIVGDYQNGIIDNNYSLSINEYGIITFINQGNIYEGLIKPYGNKFISTLRGSNGTITLNGEYVDSGLIFIRTSGLFNYSDYFSTYKVEQTGNSQYVLRKFSKNDNTYYMLFEAGSISSRVVYLTSINDVEAGLEGSINEIAYDNKILTIRIDKYNDLKTGITVADKYLGQYKNGNDILIIDGFGNAKYNNKLANYTINADYLTIYVESDIKVVKVNLNDYTFKNVEISFDNSLVSGFTYYISYSCYDDEYSEQYDMDVAFVFDDLGKVTAIAKSSGYDEDTKKDTYEPKFANVNGVKGSYTVSKNKVIVNLNGYSFVFEIKDLVYRQTISLIETSYTSDLPGYFAIGSILGINAENK